MSYPDEQHLPMPIPTTPTPARALFDLGRVVTTPGALAVLVRSPEYARTVLVRHLSGDWGDVEADDVEVNDAAVMDGDRIMSVYTVDDVLVWVITEADRSITTILLPEEY